MKIAEARRLIFSISITAIGRFLLLRDRVLGRVSWNGREKRSGARASRHSIPSGKSRLDAVLLKPEAARASLLICHGIGETVQHWLPVQQMLAASGIASLVFDYSGYGESSGLFDSDQSEQDTVCAFHCLEQLTAPLPVSILGFSLGSGIAVAVLGKIPAHRLVLCAAFTSLRNAAASARIPRAFAFAVPPIWDAEGALRDCPIDVLIVHGEKDGLFPVRMARELAAICGSRCKLVIAPNVAHNQPFRRPELSYWGPIVSWLLAGQGSLSSEQSPRSLP
jgi:pimeloyl-ACP methyl ester carboxylesterase